MNDKRVRDLMVTLEEYPVVSPEMSMLDAIVALNEAQKRRASGRQPYRAVLVKDVSGRIIGKLGQFAFLKALEPKYSLLGDFEKLRNAGVSEDLISAMLGHYRFFEESLLDICDRGRSIRVKEAMSPIEESIDESATLAEAINKIVIFQQLSILVTRGGKAVGLLRLSDLCDEIARQMSRQADQKRQQGTDQHDV